MAHNPESKKYYEAPITLGFTLSDGDLIRGTINGVEVSGQWTKLSNEAILYDESNTSVPFCTIGFRGAKTVVSVQQDSAPTTDYELHLYRYVPASIVQIPQEYVDGLEATTTNANRALETATAAQNTANKALETATAAQNTANTAKSTAESLYYTLEEKNYHGVYDKKTEGRGKFKCNAFDYYKISDFAATCVEIKQFSGTQNNGADSSDVFSGKNCVKCGQFIVVNAAGQCSYTDEWGTFEFTAPSAGLYALYNGATNPLTAGSYNFTFNIIAPIVTNTNTYKKYYITVDDSGTLSATEVT